MGISDLDLVQDLLANRKSIVEGTQSLLLSGGRSGLEMTYLEVRLRFTIYYYFKLTMAM